MAGEQLRRARIAGVAGALTVVTTLISGCSLTAPRRGRLAIPEYRRVIAEARRDTARAAGVAASSMDLGAARLGENTFRATLRNDADTAVTAALSLRTRPGLWIRGAWQGGYAVRLAPREARVVALPYQFTRLTPEAALRVSLGAAAGDSGNIAVREPAWEKWYPIGRGNPAASDPRSRFVTRRTEHLDVYAFRGSAAERDIDRIARDREAAVRIISEFLRAPFTERIRIVLYPDSATKFEQTGHVGMGWASGGNIVEIYNERQRLDPYHEIAHIVAAKVGSPPAALSEGFATYVSERLGSDALEHLGHLGRAIDAVTCALHAQARLLPLTGLLEREEIGSKESNPTVAYPQAASFTKYLVRTFGIEKFRALYAGLVSTSDPAQHARNRELLVHYTGQPLEMLERRWLAALRCGG